MLYQLSYCRINFTVALPFVLQSECKGTVFFVTDKQFALFFQKNLGKYRIYKDSKGVTVAGRIKKSTKIIFLHWYNCTNALKLLYRYAETFVPLR